MTELVPPHNFEAEASVLGACLLSKQAVAEVIGKLDQAHFHRMGHGWVWIAVVNVWGRGEAVDYVTVAEELRRLNRLDEVGGPQFLGDLCAAVPATTNARHYARLVVDCWRLRQMISAGRQIEMMGFEDPGDVDGLLGRAEKLIFDIRRGDTEKGPLPLGDLAEAALRTLEARKAGDIPAGVIPTGFPDLDDKLAGLHPGQLVTVAARPAMGKSSLAAALALNGARATGRHALLFSLEMTGEEIAARILCAEGRVDSQQVRTAHVGINQLTRLHEALGQIRDLPVSLDETAVLSTAEIRAKALRHATKHPLGLVVVDYLQLLDAPGGWDNRVAAVSEMSRNLKLLARELNIPVVACSQLNRGPENRHDKRPMLADLRESGAIEQDSDVVLMLYRDDYYNPDTANQGVVEVIVAKNRNGPPGTVKLTWEAPYMAFHSRARESA